MKRIVWFCFALFSALLVANPQLAWATAPYTENFTSDVANWANGVNAPLNFVGSGGPDGSSYASTAATGFGSPDGSRFVLFRGQNNLNSSNHAFEGDWLSSGIVEYSNYVWHNAPVALPFFVRFATPTNSPAVGGDNGVLVQPNTWTKLSYEISASQINLTLFPEGPPTVFNTVFSNIGNIQIGYTVPNGFGADANTYTFGIDQPSIAIPEPASCLLIASGTLLSLAFRRRSAR